MTIPRTALDVEKGKHIESGYHIGSLSDYTPSDDTFSDYTPGKTEQHKGQAGNPAPSSGITYKNIGGLDEIVEKLDLIVNGSRKYPEIWKHLGRKQVRGVLLIGPPGCGKTLLAQAIAHEAGRKVCLIQGAEIKGPRVGLSENNLNRAYESVRPNGILVIDEIDAIGRKRENMINETEASVVGTLLSILDGAKYKDNVIVIGTTNKPHTLDSALRRPGRFDVEIYIPPPDANGRNQIFTIHTAGMPLAQDVNLEVLAKRARGFTGADIAGVCAALSQQMLKRAVEEIKKGTPQEKIIKDLVVIQKEFCQLIDDTVPSLLRESYMEVSKLSWDDIGGLDEVKKKLQMMVIWPLLYKEKLLELHLRQPKGMLLFGPPGCGKTLIAKAMAGESKYNFLMVNGPALLSKWVGSTEEAIRDIFGKARMAKPCVIFFDEIESIAPVRGRASGGEVTDRAVSQLLAEIDGASEIKDVFVMAATNRPDLVDPALLRPGRLDLQFEVPLPDNNARRKIFEIHLRETPLQDINLEQLVELTDGFSGAEIEWASTTAKQKALERHISPTSEKEAQLTVTHDDLVGAIQEINKRKH